MGVYPLSTGPIPGISSSRGMRTLGRPTTWAAWMEPWSPKTNFMEKVVIPSASMFTPRAVMVGSEWNLTISTAKRKASRVVIRMAIPTPSQGFPSR